MSTSKRSRSATPPRVKKGASNEKLKAPILPNLILGSKGKPILIFLAGYPDDCTSGWGIDNLKSLSADYRLICLALPGYDFPRKNIQPWGWDLPAILQMLHETIEKLLAEENASTYSLIVHDWGSYIGMCYQNRHPERILKMIAFDVGITKPTIVEGLRIMFYQWYFAFSFLFSQVFSVTIANLSLLFFFYFISWTPLGPCPQDIVPRPRTEVDIQQAYPYWYFWFGPNGVLRSGLKNMPKPSLTKLLAPIPVKSEGKSAVSTYRKCPIFFMYGTKKNVMFHSKFFIETLYKTEGCRVKSFDCGHWIILSKHRHEVLTDMRTFLGSS
jgi:pimeloyl-ACP methyl ester carboxylesterase